MPEGISVADAAARLGVTTAYVRSLCARGALRAQRTGEGPVYRQSWHIDPASVEAYHAQQMRRGPKPRKEITPMIHDILLRAGKDGGNQAIADHRAGVSRTSAELHAMATQAVGSAFDVLPAMETGIYVGEWLGRYRHWLLRQEVGAE